jgi:tetratricopeptide (TPR) repeat protein
MENYLQYIDAYFNDELGAEEARQFEQRIINDMSFAEEVAFYLSAKKTVREELIKEKKEWFRQLAAENHALSGGRKSGLVKKMLVYRIAAAAGFVGIIFLSWYLFLQKPTSPNQMADKYINSNFETLSVTMSTKKDSMQDGLSLYNKKQYNSALQQFETIIQRDTANYSAKRFAGIVYLRLGNYDKALAYFQQLEKYSLYSNPAVFYQALTLLKRNQPGDKQKARQLLQQVTSQHLSGEETAQQWLDRRW